MSAMLLSRGTSVTVPCTPSCSSRASPASCVRPHRPSLAACPVQCRAADAPLEPAQPSAATLPSSLRQASQTQHAWPVLRPAEPLQPEAHKQRLPRWLKSLLTGAAALALSLALLSAACGPAMAARSGGRMGGSSFGAARSAGPSMSSGSFGGGFGGSSLGGLGRGSSMRGSTHHHSLSFGPGLGWFGSPAPLIGGGYGVQTYQSGGGGFGNIILLAVGAAIVYGLITSFLDNRADSGSAGYDDSVSDAYSERVTVAKVQVGLLGTARKLQSDLERIADRADTETTSGLHYVLQETVLALRRNPQYCIYGAAQTFNERSLNRGEDTFNRISMEERGKYKEETLVNFGGRSRSAPSRSGSSGPQELIVVTILLASKGGMKVPMITSQEELKDALNKLGAVRSDQVFAVEVLWTPQDPQDSYSRDELFEDFPTLNSL